MKYQVIIPDNLEQYPEPHEISAAHILCRYFNSTVTFLQKRHGYHQHTPDVIICDIEWEMKSPKSRKMDKIRQNIEQALDQSGSVVIDTRRTKIADEKILAMIERSAPAWKKIKRLIVIRKDKSVQPIR